VSTKGISKGGTWEDRAGSRDEKTETHRAGRSLKATAGVKARASIGERRPKAKKGVTPMSMVQRLLQRMKEKTGQGDAPLGTYYLPTKKAFLGHHKFGGKKEERLAKRGLWASGKLLADKPGGQIPSKIRPTTFPPAYGDDAEGDKIHIRRALKKCPEQEEGWTSRCGSLSGH